MKQRKTLLLKGSLTYILVCVCVGGGGGGGGGRESKLRNTWEKAR